MGIIQKQAVKGTLYSYVGVVVGFLTASILFPRILQPEQIGLLNILVSYSFLYAQFATLGFSNVITRMFPYFRDYQQQHKGFLFVVLVAASLGFLLALLLFWWLRPAMISENVDNRLFADYIYFLVPLIFFTLLFLILDNYYKMLYNAVKGIALKEFFQRVFILSSILLYFFDLVSFHYFVIFYCVSLSLPSLILLISLLAERQIFLKPQPRHLTAPMRRSIISVALFGLIVGFSTTLTLHIDRVMVSTMLGLTATGIYGTTYIFGNLIIIPSRSLKKIASTIIADAWKENDLKTIDTVYRKSSINQLIIGLLLFIGIWANIGSVFDHILPKEYASGKYVIFFIGLMNVFEMMAGVSMIVILNSKYYRFQTYFSLAQFALVVAFNVIFIPILGLIGAALASFVAMLLFQVMRYLFIYFKFGLHPFSIKHFYVVIIGVLAYLTGYFIPEFSNFVLDIFVRSTVISIVFGSLILITKASTDVNERARVYWSFLVEKTAGFFKK